MPATILDTPTAEAYATNTFPAISAGSNRKALLAACATHSSDAAPATACTIGGVSATVVGTIDDAGAGADACITLFELDETDIAAMSGSAVVVSGWTADWKTILMWTVQGTDQATPTPASSTGYRSSGADSLVRVADSLTFYVINSDDVDPTSPITAMANPAEIDQFKNTTWLVWGYATDTARTIDATFTADQARWNTSMAVNFAPATASSPTLSTVSGDDTYADGDTAIPVTGAALDLATDLRVQDSGATYQDSLTAGVVVSDPNNATFNDARVNTPLSTASWQLQLRVSDGTTPDTLNITRNPAAGWAVVEAAGTLVISGDNSVVTPYTGPDPVVTDQVLYETTSTQGGTVVVNADLTFSVTYGGAIPASDSFDIEVWSDGGSGRVWTAVTVNVEDGVVVSGSAGRRIGLRNSITPAIRDSVTDSLTGA